MPTFADLTHAMDEYYACVSFDRELPRAEALQAVPAGGEPNEK